MTELKLRDYQESVLAETRRVFKQRYKRPLVVPMPTIRKGMSDLLFIGKRKLAFIETKTPSGRPTPEQIKFLDHMKQLGHIEGIARSVEEAVRIFECDRT